MDPLISFSPNGKTSAHKLRMSLSSEKYQHHFADFYDGHKRRNWANFGSPFLVCFLCCALTTVIYTLPVLTMAKPDIVSCNDDINDVSTPDEKILDYNNQTECLQCRNYGYSFKDNWVSSTIITQFMQFCTTALYENMFSLQFLAQAVTLYSGFLADRFGRKPVLAWGCFGIFFLSMILPALGGLALTAYTVLWLLIMALLYLDAVSCTYYSEIVRPNDKARYYPLVACCGWGFGIILVALVGLIGTNWTHFIYIIGVLCFFLGCFIISLPRSFVWLFSRSRNEEGRMEIIEIFANALDMCMMNHCSRKYLTRSRK